MTWMTWGFLADCRPIKKFSGFTSRYMRCLEWTYSIRVNWNRLQKTKFRMKLHQIQGILDQNSWDQSQQLFSCQCEHSKPLHHSFQPYHLSLFLSGQSINNQIHVFKTESRRAQTHQIYNQRTCYVIYIAWIPDVGTVHQVKCCSCQCWCPINCVGYFRMKQSKKKNFFLHFSNIILHPPPHLFMCVCVFLIHLYVCWKKKN